MERPNTSRLRIGDWNADPASGTIARNGETIRLEVRSMRLLLCLAEHAGQVVSIDELISNVWAGVAVSPDSVYQVVTALRRQLGDDPRRPAYIETVPRLGYRLIAVTCPWVETLSGDSTKGPVQPQPSAETGNFFSRRVDGLLWVAVGLAVSIAFGFLLHIGLSAGNRGASASVAPPTASVAVLPFLDLTEGMRDEEFADGMTEELIDKLSKLPGLSVPSATSSFYLKGKEVPVAEIAKQLNVAFLLDGSVRKSNGRVRIAARLVRADNHFVVWSETYDRPFGDLIMVQDEIAGEVAKALKASLLSEPASGNSH